MLGCIPLGYAPLQNACLSCIFLVKAQKINFLLINRLLCIAKKFKIIIDKIWKRMI